MGIALLFAIALGITAQAQTGAPQRLELHLAKDRLSASNVVNVVTFSAPRVVPLRELGLESLSAANGIMIADEIRIFASRDVMDRSPAVRIWRNAREGGRWWYQTGGSGSAEDHVIQPGQVVLVILRSTTNDILWKNPLAVE